MKTFEYRLYPKKEQSRLLMQCLIQTRDIYNEMLAMLKEQYEKNGTFPSKYDLTAAFKGRGGEHVPASVVQMIADRLSKALKRFLAGRELGVKVGFPRFKTPNRWHSIQLRQYHTEQVDQALQSEPAPKSGGHSAMSQPAKSTKCTFSGIVQISLKRFLESGVELVECPDCNALRTLEPHAGVLRFKSHDKRKTNAPHIGQRWARGQTG